MNETRPLMQECPAKVSANATPDGDIALVSVDDDLHSSVLLFTPATAARLGHWLVDLARQVETP